MTQIIEKLITQVNIGEPQSFQRLTMFPLTGVVEQSIDYLTLDEALRTKTASVSEVSEAGSVPDLKFVNDGKKPVFLLDGEELIGAKQNRILNLSVLAPSQAEIIIPVSCVERGRWEYNSERFESSDRSFFSEARARKARMVSESLDIGFDAMSDQCAIWDEVDRKSTSFGVRSDSDAMSDIYEAQGQRIDQFVEAIHQTDEQVGALFVIGNNVAGLDIFDKPSTLKKLLPKLVRSYALDALDDHYQGVSENNENAISNFMEAVSAVEFSPSSAVGMGEDYRIKGDVIAGGALINDGQIIHFCAFPLIPVENDDHQFDWSWVGQASNRRRMA